MNKKFSTLVASLLLSSAFSVYAGNAKPMLAIPTQVETRATSADVEKAVEWTGAALNIPASVEDAVLEGFTNNARIAQVTGNQAGSFLSGAVAGEEFSVGAYSSTPADFPYYYWHFINGHLVNNAGETFSVTAGRDYFEIVPLTVSGKATSYFVFGQRNSDGSLSYVQRKSDNTGFVLVSNLQDASVYVSVETDYKLVVLGEDANDKLGGAFNLFISSLKDEAAIITNAEAFAGDLTAMKTTTVEATTENSFYIKNGNKFIVFDKDAEVTSDGYSQKGKFVLVDAANVAAYGDFAKFQIKKADNGSSAIKVSTGTSFEYRLYIANVNNTYGLTVASQWGGQKVPTENWAVTSFDDDNVVDLREFLTGEFYTVDFVSSEATDDEYKENGRLAVREANKADYVKAAGLYAKAPEAQWAVSTGTNGNGDKFNGTITLTNRENPEAKLVISKLRRVDAGFEVVLVSGNTGVKEGDIVKINAVSEHSKNDGYAVINDNDLRNETYYLGQLRKTADGDINVYWAENHAASHQIGATVEEANASKWNLSLVNKTVDKHTNETDSILIVSELQKWNTEKNRVDAVKDTLVILPYAFQNRSNNEFVEMNDQVNLEYYICNKDNKVNATIAQRFALKMKADGAYNYVALRSTGLDEGATQTYNKDGGVIALTSSYAKSKVFQENSTENGTWRNMGMYANDANSLMFVTKVDAPEYRKLETTANLDTIKIYRAENEAQVVYEKRDDKSVVDGRTLSFLNIDNVEQFKDINPALYADTAYVNRGNNTRYQYLLGVNIEHKEGFYCAEHGFATTKPCEHAVPVSYNEGRYLINMIDTANVYGKTAGIHNNPYINETEEGRTLSKLSFVDAIHVLTDSTDMTKADKLYVINGAESKDKYTVLDLSTKDFNVAKFAFKYIDSMEGSDFKIQTQWKDYDPANYNKPGYATSENGYLRWVNGCIVVDSDYTKGDVFNMDENETRTPTANEEITAESSVVVAGTNGAVVVKGAEGKSVIVSTILGKVVANEVLTSDNATIAAPAGVVVVSVDGESFKVVVK